MLRNLLVGLFKKRSKFEKKLYHLLGFFPNDPKIYLQALTHKSINKDLQIHNERLEFLGDAILGSIIGELLYDKFPEGKEGFLTQTRSKIVSRKSLNELAIKVGLKKLVRHKDAGRAHSIYGNALEALIGAIMIDKGRRYCFTFIKEKLIDKHLNFEQLIKIPASFKGKILEWSQANDKKIKFVKISSQGLDHAKKYTIGLEINQEKISQATATSIKRAEEKASELALKKIAF